MHQPSNRTFISLVLDRRFRAIFLFGIASGLPSSLVFATLSIWLREEGVSRTSIGLIGAAATPYAINFLWAPLLDYFRWGKLTKKLGQRRSWILICQIVLVPSVVIMGFCDPKHALTTLGACAFLVSFVSATQDVAIDAYRIEILRPHEYGAGAATAIYGWHTGAFLTGAGALYIAAYDGWMTAYIVAGCIIALVAVGTFLAQEPHHPKNMIEVTSGIRNWFVTAVISPIGDVFARLGWAVVLVFGIIVFYKFGDAMLGRMAGVFYVDLGFSKIEIANYSKSIGLFATLFGVGVGGWVCTQVGVIRAMYLGAVLMMVTNLSFGLLSYTGKDFGFLAGVVFFDNLTGGVATTAFVAYLSGLCNIAFTATQYALFASLGNFARIQLGSISGWAVDILSGEWALFFLLVAVTSVPSILLLWLLTKLQTRTFKKPLSR